MAKISGWAILAIAVVAIYIFSPGTFSGITNLFSTSGGGTTTTSGTTGLCVLDSINLKVNDEALGKTSVNPAESSAIFIDGISYGNLADNTALTVPTQKPYTIYEGWNAGSPTLFYIDKATGNTDCTDPLQLAAKLPRRTTLATGNWSVYGTSWDGTILSDINATNGAGNVSMAANDAKDVVYHWRLGQDYYYGNPASNGNVLVLEAMPGLYDKLEVVGATTAPVPRSHRTSTKDKFAYLIPTLKSNTEVAETIHIDTGVVNPGISSGNVTSGVWMYMYDKDYDLNADTNAEILDVEDETGNALGTSLPWIGYISVS